jgi:hypothetical protein
MKRSTLIVLVTALSTMAAVRAGSRPRMVGNTGCTEDQLLDVIAENPQGWDVCTTDIVHGELGFGPKTWVQCRNGHVQCCSEHEGGASCENLDSVAPLPSAPLVPGSTAVPGSRF